MSEGRVTMSIAISSAARSPERTAAAALRLSAHRRVYFLQGGGRRRCWAWQTRLLDSAQCNQPRRRARPCSIITSLAQNKLLHLQEAQLARLPLPAPTVSPPPYHHHHPSDTARHIAFVRTYPLRSTRKDPRFPTKVTREKTIPNQAPGTNHGSISLRAQHP